MFKLQQLFKYLTAIIITIIIASSCSTVKPYQRAYLEDRDMKFSQNEAEKFEHSAHTSREGAAGGGMGKSSGGCGCN